MTKQLRRRLGRGVLATVTLLLATSGAIRITAGTGEVFAEEAEPTRVADHPVSESQDGECNYGAGIAQALEEIKSRNAQLDTREGEIADRLSALILVKQEVENNITALERAEKRLASLISLSEEAAESDLSRLTAVYESMKPKDAAVLFQEMPADFAAGFLARMRPDIAATVLANLDPSFAYSISVNLAARNANAPKD